MTNNDKLRRLRYALDISDREVVELFALAGYELDSIELEALFKREDDEGFIDCPDHIAALFLRGLVISRRGNEGSEVWSPERGQEITKNTTLSNNDILKGVRIALKLRSEDVFELIRSFDRHIGKTEVNAFFRKKGQPNYRPCGDQYLRYFLNGLTQRYRGSKQMTEG